MIKFLAHTTRRKHPFSKTDSLSPHLEKLLFTESHWFLKLLKTPYDFSGPLKEFQEDGPTDRSLFCKDTARKLLRCPRCLAGSRPLGLMAASLATGTLLEPGSLLPHPTSPASTPVSTSLYIPCPRGPSQGTTCRRAGRQGQKKGHRTNNKA